MDKKTLSVGNICTKYITPAFQKVDWDLEFQAREEYPLTNRHIIIVQGNLYQRAERKHVNYILIYRPNIPITVIHAYRNILTKDCKFYRNDKMSTSFLKGQK